MGPEQKTGLQGNTKSRLWGIDLSYRGSRTGTRRAGSGRFGIYAPRTKVRVVNFTIGVKAKG